MREPIFRNLDTPFQIMGFNYLELMAVCFIFVIASELSESLHINRFFSFSITALVVASWYWIRRSMGEKFGSRLVRFIFLPKNLKANSNYVRDLS